MYLGVSQLSDKGRCLEGIMKALVIMRFPGQVAPVSACVLFTLTSRLPQSQGRSSWTAVKVSSGPGRVLPPLGLLEAAGLAGESGAHNSLAAFNVPWT